MGCVVFHYDMVGNADSQAIVHRQGFTDPEAGNLGLDGVFYDPLSNDLSWSSTLVLLRHVFAGSGA